jgi:prepilin-type N-terminal cleavage/methylation domain-containing protein
MNKLSRGFTLFEILIVVVIIGLLAVGLIAAIDPIESIRKTGDTNLQVNANVLGRRGELQPAQIL